MKGIKGEIIDGRYEIKRNIGGGGFGRVYLAKQISFGRNVVIKTIAPELRKDEILRERFFREAKLICNINHPNIITYFDFGEDNDGDLFLVMEYLKGSTLKEVLKIEPFLPFHRIANIVSQSCDALYEIHSTGIVHRDLKPSNIFITKDKKGSEIVKLIDFGIVGISKEIFLKNELKELQSITKTDYIIGTPEYIAPEGIKGERIDARFDIYSLGVLCYELLTGEKPFKGESKLIILLQHLREAPPSFSEISHGRYTPYNLEKVILKSLSKEPAMRFQNALEFKEEFLRSSSSLLECSSEKTISKESALFLESLTVIEKRRNRKFLKILPLFLIISGFIYLIFSYWTWGKKESLEVLKLQIRNSEQSILTSKRFGIDKNFIAKKPSIEKKISIQKEKNYSKISLTAVPWAMVYIDGKFKGKTPIVIEKILSGLRTIKLTHPKFQSKEIKIKLKKGEFKKLKVDMRKF